MNNNKCRWTKFMTDCQVRVKKFNCMLFTRDTPTTQTQMVDIKRMGKDVGKHCPKGTIGLDKTEYYYLIVQI